ncbi:MAG TPA: hypothetical protein VNN62_23320 [Methylomirabilota bacterium]|nr:hypothetical protein [Methylomirabilota bacterium]
MMTLPLIIERLTRVAPFGVRFWDAVSHRFVSDDLFVTAYLPNHPARRYSATPNRSGVYVLHHVPGLETFEYGAGDDAFWANLPPPRLFVVEVNDLQRRFHPMAFTAALPSRGIFGGEDPAASPRTAVQSAVPLYSAPARTVPGGMAVVRAHLWDGLDDSPAAWALVEAQSEGQTPIRAVADEQGRVAVFFPYPEPPPRSLASPLGSPPGGEPRLLAEQTWPLRLRVFYSPRKPPPPVPLLEDVLHQTPATPLSSLSPLAPLPEVRLAFGQELIVKSQFRSELLVIPLGSPL